MFHSAIHYRNSNPNLLRLVTILSLAGLAASILTGCGSLGGGTEECGLRCVYLGWKFDVDGSCVDMPSEPAESNFKSKVKVTSYPTHESGGVIWTYKIG